MKKIHLAAVPMALLSLPAMAQNSTEFCEPSQGCTATSDPQRADIVVTATGAAQLPEESGLAITLYDSAAIARAQPATVADLIIRTPGVTISNTGPVGGFSAVRLRGAEGEQTLVLIDGVRANDPASPGGGFDFGNLLIGNIDRIEILRGPNSVPWGSQAIGGVVNIVTRAAEESFEARLRGEYGGTDRKTAVANVGGRTGALRFSLGGGWFRDEGISAAASGRERDGYRQFAANGRMEVAISDAVRLHLRGYHANSRAELDGFPPPNYDLADTPEYSTTLQSTGYAGIEADTGRLWNNLSLTLSDINRDNFASPDAADPEFLARGRNERIEYRGDWNVADGFRTVFGAEHERSRFSDGASLARTHYSGAYAQAILDPLPELTITVGARIDDHANYGTKTTFSANGAWRPAARTLIRVAYGEGFKAPTLFQLFSFFGDPALQPEEASNRELGIEQWAIDGRLRLGVTAYRRLTRNMIDFDLFAYRYNNILYNRAKGIEAFLELRPDDRLVLSANYSYTDSKGRQNTTARFSRRIRVPVHSINLSADWTAKDRLRLGADLRLASDSLDGFGGSVRMDGYVLIALRASYRLSDSIELFGRVENAGNVRYQTVAGYGSYGRNAFIGMRAGF